jgi:hypothetical protein
MIATNELAGAAGRTPEELMIAGEQLAALKIRYDAGVRLEEVFHIKGIDEDFFRGVTAPLAARGGRRYMTMVTTMVI